MSCIHGFAAKLVALLLAAALAMSAAQAASTPGRAAVEKLFRVWLETELRPKAVAAGVSPRAFDAALKSVTLDWKLPDLAPPGSEPVTPQDQFQSEFRAPAGYFAEKNLGAVVAGGAARLNRHAAILRSIEKKSGVPGRILVAVWGRESGFGRAALSYDAFTVLATKAFMSTRKELFEKELLAALMMVEKGIPAALMKSSWAGALGQPQFLPSSYLENAADGDGDGRADIWKSEADTLASIANYLKNKGWAADREWGFEVTVPASVSCVLEGPDRGQAVTAWEALGIRRVNDMPFPQGERKLQAFLLMPAGRLGPAFLVTSNFYALKAYNESDLYALFIGVAADRAQFGGNGIVGKWRPVDTMLRSAIAALQLKLEALGHDVGGADGLAGFKTRRSIGAWQEKSGLAPECFPTAAVLATLAK